MGSRWAFLGLVLVVIAVGGCNIFGSAAKTESSGDYVAEGLDHLWNSEYSEAEASFTKAIEQDPADQQARWGRAKARLRGTGYTAINLLTEVSTLNMTPGTGQRTELPFMGAQWTTPELNKLYIAFQGVVEDLTWIYEGRTHGGELEPSDVALDYAGAVTLNGILTLKDTNLDHVIDANDIDVLAAFTGNSQLVIDQWNNLSPAEQTALVNNVITQLGTTAEAIVEALGESGVIDREQLEEFINQFKGDLEGFKP
jgi:hypothetical protein